MKEPYGTVLIIGPFNYPVQLVFEPLIGAIAAGNTAIIKPSELTPHTTEVVKHIIESSFEHRYISIVEGSIDETQTLLHLPLITFSLQVVKRLDVLFMKQLANN